MISKWTAHLKTPEDVEDFKRTFNHSRPVLARLQQIVEEKLQSLDIQETSLENYNSPNWAYKQAHQNGFRQALSAFKLLTDQESTNDPKQLIRTNQRPT